jgi:chemotaxis methyl-accepting protein methylase
MSTVAAEALADRVGLRLDEGTRSRVARAVRDAAAGAGEAEERWAQRVRREPAALDRLIDAVTVQESSFFRDPAHFEHLVGEALPQAGGEGLIWSAGCANGQEPWSLAMALEEAGANGWRILATDVSPGALARAEAGEYHERELRGLSDARRRRFLTPLGNARFAVRDSLRPRVSFARHSLVADPPPSGLEGQVVLCRNVLMYIDDALVARVLEALSERLAPDGWLYLGGGEATGAALEHFRLIPLGGGGLAYRPRAGQDERTASPVRARGAPRPTGPAARATELTRRGERAAGRGELTEAVSAFRQAALLCPQDPLAHLRLALALERARSPGARQSYEAARSALERTRPASLSGGLGGWALQEIERLLAEKVGPAD